MKNDKISESFEIHDPEAVYEMALQAYWNNLPDGITVTASDGTRVQILSRGEWNHEAGPDFLNAKIRHHDTIIKGSIELHRKSSDYIRHGHLFDAAYDNVILHIVTEDDLSGKNTNAAMAHIPVCCLSAQTLKRQAYEKDCRCRFFPYMDIPHLRIFFSSAGIERIQQKSTLILENLIRSGTGPAFRNVLFRIAGYKRNQGAFEQLQQRIEQYSQDLFAEHFESLIWGESGLLPDPAAGKISSDAQEITHDLWNDFWGYRLGNRSPIEWKHDSVRPQNSPERRIAMIIQFFKHCSVDPLPEFAIRLRNASPKDFAVWFRHEFQLHDPFWDRHFSFLSSESAKPSAILGSERTETLLIDGIVPSILAYAKLNSDLMLEKQSIDLLKSLDAQRNNRIFKNAVKRWFPEDFPVNELFEHADTVQGCLHIHKTYCASTAGDCLSCLLANS